MLNIKKEIVKQVKSAHRAGCRVKHAQFRPMMCRRYKIDNDTYWALINELISEKKIVSLGLGWMTV